tara:strand:- start:682 stop:1041 length:360 start_codon:yes stop_codon:yes gene_type:complete
MSEIKHTPGPWDRSGSRIKMNGLQWHRIFKYSPDTKKDVNIACVIYDADTGDGFADACLIAAAPELLDELKQAVYAMGLMADILRRLVADDKRCATFLAGLDMTLSSANAAINKAEGRS